MPPAKRPDSTGHRGARYPAFRGLAAMRHRRSAAALLLSLSFWSATAFAQALMFDGDFENGSFAGWQPGERGQTVLAARGQCFADGDTRALPIRGRYAALLRGAASLQADEAASLTSKPFVAAKGVLFMALSESAEPAESRRRYTLQIDILDQDGKLLRRQPLASAQQSLAAGCPSERRAASFSEHFISTRQYTGQTIRLRFRQHPDIARSGLFTLIDQVSMVEPGTASAYYDHPRARAGLEFDARSGALYLKPGRSENQPPDPDWQYRWQIDAEAEPRAYYNPCINDLPAGNHRALLRIRNGDKVSTDSLRFYVPDNLKPAPASATETNLPRPGRICNHRNAPENPSGTLNQ